MSCFDTVNFACPGCCATIPVQSKSGPCDMGTHDALDTPLAIAADLIGEIVTCDKCGRTQRISRARALHGVPLTLSPIPTDGGDA